MLTKRFVSTLFGALLCTSSAVSTAVSEQEAARLGKDLTPVGAEQKANADGTIPEWSGGEREAPAGWKSGKPRHESWPHVGDKPLYTIDASNMDKYADKLTEGQKALLKTFKGYKMEVYPTRRTCGFPDFVYERTKTNAVSAKTSADGLKVEKAIGAAVPFPIPANAQEVIWNHKLRYQGEGFKMKFYSFISPPKGRDAWIKLYNDWLVTMPFHAKDNKGIDEVKGLEVGFIYDTKEPEARVGERLLYKWYVNKGTDAWLYFPGQRRVRRLPTYSYDAPIMGNENTKVVDQFWMFNGEMDRYEWKLIGKQELIVPYNAFKAYDFSASEDSIKNPDHYPRELTRYELHRVWVVEATVAPGKRHTMPKRRFYIDEDSWHALVVDHYDAQGKIWRVSEAFPMPVWELGACTSITHVGHDVKTLRWLVDSTPYSTGEDVDWLYADKGKMKKAHFTVDYLRRSSRR